jgi:hypothetical protein
MLNINYASYGGSDCTQLVRSKINKNKLVLRADNNLIGDVSPGIIKYLQIEGEYNGVLFSKLIKEGNIIVYPETKTDRLGVFYSNNNNAKIYPAINKSLDTIKIAAEGKADIVTCMWQPMPGNPFLEIKSCYTSYSHLNQLLQILQSLYVAKEMGDYKYVSFLEHDVMYAKGYFDYDEFEKGEVLTNMNYGGLCKSGWQQRGQADEPFHQMTMRFDDAIEHCLNILPNALVTNSGMIETQELKRIQWESPEQSIHINHGVHFTSHNSIYKKTDIIQEHPYWGKHEEYLNLFNELN